MSHADIRAALDPIAERERPFAAKTRKVPPRVTPPDVLHFDVPYRQ